MHCVLAARYKLPHNDPMTEFVRTWLRLRALALWGAALACSAAGAAPGAVDAVAAPVAASAAGAQPVPAGAVPTAAPSGMASRVLACTACHGKEGRATPDGGCARIAGKAAG